VLSATVLRSIPRPRKTNGCRPPEGMRERARMTIVPMKTPLSGYARLRNCCMKPATESA